MNGIAEKLGDVDYRIHLVGVGAHTERIAGIMYNCPISYEEELMYAYNTNCVLEVLNPGQTGVSLRTCEAVCFQKKLLTNNRALQSMPFYDERYMRIFDNPEDIDSEFIRKKEKVNYSFEPKEFSPLRIIEKLEEMAD